MTNAITGEHEAGDFLRPGVLKPECVEVRLTRLSWADAADIQEAHLLDNALGLYDVELSTGDRDQTSINDVATVLAARGFIVLEETAREFIVRRFKFRPPQGFVQCGQL